MSAELMKSQFVRRLSSVRPSVSQLSLNLMHGFLSNFSCSFPWAINSDVFLIFEKTFFFFLIFYEYFSFSLTWDPMGAKISKRYVAAPPQLSVSGIPPTASDHWNTNVVMSSSSCHPVIIHAVRITPTHMVVIISTLICSWLSEISIIIRHPVRY